ncbi:glucokinase [Dyella sp. 20L07]|uniref:glucokinase n=1 Tax=Dyella sp. 20L07 TaxID=3384240 RepID=UPI003D26B706
MHDGGQTLNEAGVATAFDGDTLASVLPVAWRESPADNRQLLLAADVGGTHARIGLMAFDSNQSAHARTAPVMLAYRVYACRDYPGLDAIVRSFCDELAVKPRRFALGCAGYLHDGRVINSNLQWPIEPAALERALQIDEVHVLNDFVALAHATTHLDANAVTALHTPRRVVDTAGAVVVIGPGTGLGVAVRLPGPPQAVLATEAGHIQMATRAGREHQVLGELAAADMHVAYDHVLSGPGLLRVYQALCRLEGRSSSLHMPADVVAAACNSADPCAVETLQLFCGWLGSFCGDMAMLYNATGGIYLAGGFLTHMKALLETSTFVDRFLDKGVMRPFLQTVPIHLVDHAQLGVVGAASWLLERPPA